MNLLTRVTAELSVQALLLSVWYQLCPDVFSLFACSSYAFTGRTQGGVWFVTQ